MIRKIEKLLLKIEYVWILLGFIILLVFISVVETDNAIKVICTTVAIPIMSFLLQNAIKRKQDNNCYNIDFYMLEHIAGEIVWKSSVDNCQEDITYLVVKNTGKIDIFSLYIKIIKHDGTIGRFYLSETLKSNEEWIVRIPYKRESIKEIVISSSLLTESRTKKFNGIQSGNENKYIFSNLEFLDEQKYALHHEQEVYEFEKLERFWI